VKAFMRTATEDTVVRDVPINAGESVLLPYVAANRDEDVFDDPFGFDVGRDPNKHLAFGHGVHFCLGAALATVELTGEPDLTATTFVGGLKHLPIRYTMR